jgi:cardiolipin synthase A/B
MAMKPPKPRNVVAALVLAGALIVMGLALAQDQETLKVRFAMAAGDARVPEEFSRLLGDLLSEHDGYVVHTNGDAAFPAMLAAIERAKHRISFETYIFEEGEIATRFVDAFEAAARRGVSVRLIIDSVGASTVGKEPLERLERAGCEIGWFNPVASWSIEEANYRTHRKILVVDGEVAFVGGMGIADRWWRDTEEDRRWRDTQIEIDGPAAVNVEAGFYENWIETGGIVDVTLTPRDEDSAGTAKSIVLWSSPEGGANELKLLYLLAIAAARESIYIQSPYLITDESTEWSLLDARRRGVAIRMLVEGDLTDAKPVKFASRSKYGEFLAAGVEVYEYQPAMMHAKAFVVDGVLSIIGSANFDNRSLELNDELNIAAFDRQLAARLIADFERDVMSSTRLTADEWRSRPPHIRGREKLWSFFGEVF